MKGKLIMFSGIDGSGKTTVANELECYLKSIGIKTVVIDAMKDGCFTTQLKRTCSDNLSLREKFSPEMLNLTWSADFVFTFQKIVFPTLEDGYWVLLHRSDLCCKVYSNIFSRDDNISKILIDSYKINPNLHFFLNISPELAYKRVLNRNKERALESKETIEYMKKASEEYHRLLKNGQYSDVIEIDSTKNIDCIMKSVIFYVNQIIDSNEK